MIKKSLLLTTALFLGAGVAHAADIVDTSVSDWSGLYAGIHGGFGSGTFDYPMKYSEELYCPSVDTSCDRPNDPSISDYDFGADITSSGFFGGVQGGWNWVHDSMVLGIEGDIARSDINGELEFYSDTANTTISGHSTVDWIGTARVRGGFLAMPELLLYATGGLAWGSVSSEYEFDGFGPESDDTTESHMGWTIGGGLEYMITDALSLKTEYLYIDLGEEEILDYSSSCGKGVICNLSIDQDISFHTIRAGLNWHFYR